MVNGTLSKVTRREAGREQFLCSQDERRGGKVKKRGDTIA